MKIFFVLIIALAAVIYHNTDSGREMERRIGEEISIERLAERGKELFSKVIDSLLLKGMDRDRKQESKKSAGKAEKKESLKSSPRPVQEKTKGADKTKNVENIADEERKKLEAIIESGG